MINNYTDKPLVKLPSECKLIFNALKGWSYSHHPFITFFKGKFHAIWSNGRVNEDDCGQRVMHATSENFIDWSVPEPLVNSIMGIGSELVLTACGFYQHNGVLNAYFGHYEYDPSSLQAKNLRPKGDIAHINVGLSVVSTTDGVNWSAPRELGIPMGANFGPQPTKSGRLIISGSIVYPYSDDISGTGKFTLTGIYESIDNRVRDDSEAIEVTIKRKQWRDARLICEGSFFQTDDGVIHMMLRSNTPRLWCTESTDDGTKWSEPFPTEFSDDHAKFHFGRLPDGRFYYVGNPIPRSGRNPLVLCLSEDGINFNMHYILRDEPYKQQFEGMYKGGLYGYPCTLIHDGYMYVIYSKRKESVEATRFQLSKI